MSGEQEVRDAMAAAHRAADANQAQGAGVFVAAAHASQLPGRASLKEQRDPGSMGNPEGESR
jgi:hypothetical protein